MLFVSYSFEIFVSCFHVNIISQHLYIAKFVWGEGGCLLQLHIQEKRKGPKSIKYWKKETGDWIETYQLVEVGLSLNCLTLIIETLKD